MSFENFPYTNFHDLNLDWIIQKIKECYSPDNPPENVVLSVNGETGQVVLYKDAVVQLPTVEESVWGIFRKADNTDEGIQFLKGYKAQRIDGTHRYDMYDTGNPPPYPVTSVNGETGDVTSVKSVNGATGVVTLYPNAVIHFPDVEETVWGIYRKADNTDEGIQFIKGQKAQRIDGVQRYDIFDAGNPPPYPVSSVNTLTGAVAILDTTIVTDGGTQKIKISFPVTSVDGATGVVNTWGNSGNAVLKPPVEAQGDIWGFERDIPSGTLGIELEYDETEGEASGYIVFDDGVNPASRIKILTPNDIPSSSGVVSFNGQTGAVTCTGADLAVSGSDSTKIDVALTYKAMASELDIVVDGDSSTVNITAGQFVSVRNSTITGITDGIYKAANNISANTTISSSDLTAVTAGALNDLNSNLASKVPSSTTNIKSSLTPSKCTINTALKYQIGKLVTYELDFITSQSISADTQLMSGFVQNAGTRGSCVTFRGTCVDGGNWNGDLTVGDGKLVARSAISSGYRIRCTVTYLAS